MGGSQEVIFFFRLFIFPVFRFRNREKDWCWTELGNLRGRILIILCLISALFSFVWVMGNGQWVMGNGEIAGGQCLISIFYFFRRMR